jgi:signal transduction histidine kinase
MAGTIDDAAGVEVTADPNAAPVPDAVSDGTAAVSGRSVRAFSRRSVAGGENQPDQRSRWLELGRSTKAKLLGAYVALLAVSAILSTVALGQVLAIQLENRIEDDLQQEILELERLVGGVDPATSEPFTTLNALFDVYFRRNVTGHEEAMLAYVDGSLYRADLERYPVSRIPDAAVDDWEAFVARGSGNGGEISGRFETVRGEASYIAQPVAIGDQSGALVVTILPATQVQEIGRLRTYGAGIVFAVLLVASVVAWLVIGRVLRPVEELTGTARSISQSDLTRRIEVRGSDEAAEMARSFNAMLDRLETVFECQRRFVEDAGHELRDPLTISRGHLELLGDDPVERRATVALVLDEIERMARIVDNLQFLAEADQLDFVQTERLDMAAFTEQLLAKASALAPRAWTLDRVGVGVAEVDRYRLTEAVMNLAHNAVQYTDADDVIAIGSDLAGGEWRLWVRDTGTGIAAADQERIFERFARGSTAGREHRGSGLGLALVEAIAEGHGGRVDLVSRLGEGSTFTIVLPVRPDVEVEPWPAS